jgi:hypothetical protein
MFTVIVTLIYFVPQVVILYNLFTRAQHPGWQAIIPGYSYYVMGKIAKKDTLAWIAGISGALYWVLYLMSAFASKGSYFSTSNGNSGFYSILGIVAFVVGLSYLFTLVYFSRCYKNYSGFWVLYLFIPLIAVFTFRKVNYVGAGSQMSDSPPTTNMPQFPTTQPSA